MAPLQGSFNLSFVLAKPTILFGPSSPVTNGHFREMLLLVVLAAVILRAMESLSWWAWKTPVDKKHKPNTALHGLLSFFGFNIANTFNRAYVYHETDLNEGHVTPGHSWKLQCCTLTLEHTSGMSVCYFRRKLTFKNTFFFFMIRTQYFTFNIKN